MTAYRSLTTAVALALGLIVGAWAAEEQTSYGYVRTLEGSGTIISADTDGLTALQLNHPVLTGDRVLVDPGSRVELVLADFSILRLGGETDLELSRLAYSADSAERATTLVLSQGELQIVVTEYALGDELPAVVLPGATVFLHDPGSYRISASEEFGQVVVREGYAEVSTERGSAIARADEVVQVEGSRWPTVSVLQAGHADALEVWGDELLTAAEYSAPGDVDPALSYSASALEGAGEWVEIEGEEAWSPHVEETWRPYTRGTWTTTPAGMYWVGQENWGWVTGHYGHWSLHPHHGWLWYPGAAWSPAWVHWYWGPTWVGWVPFGYYDRFYRSRFGLGFGYYGWAGGSWGHYRHWTFCPTPYLGRGGRHYSSGRDMPRRTGRTAVPRGVITTDTRGVNSANWRDGVRVGEMLSGGARQAGRTRPDADVTAFIARQPDLSSDVVASVGRSGGSTVRRTGSRQRVEIPAARSLEPTRQLGAISSTRPNGGYRSSRLAAPSGQAWREGTSSRRLYTVSRGVGEAGQQAAMDSAARVREAWRLQPAGRERSGSYRGREVVGATRDRYGLHGLSTTRSASPARRVVEGVTSARSPARGQVRSSTRAKPSRSQPSARQRSGGGSASRPSSVRQSGGAGRRPAASGRTSSPSKTKSGSGRASSSRSKSSRDGGSSG